VREFGEWCGEHGVRGKYSVVPNPACVGWLDRELPGWSRQELLDSLRLVRELLLPHWDIHPEMITHTRVIDIRTGRLLEEISAATMENSYPQTKKSVDELAAYLAYALRILKNCDLPCDGITTPGGFGNGVESELSLAVQESVRDVYGSEIPHYFKYVADGPESTQPRLEHVRDAETADPRLTVSIYAGTGDWFGGWDGDLQPEGDRYCNRDATRGRLVELIERGEPAVMLCHWPGMYTHGTKQGFAAFQNIVLALEDDMDEAQRNGPLLGGEAADAGRLDGPALHIGRSVRVSSIHRPGTAKGGHAAHFVHGRRTDRPDPSDAAGSAAAAHVARRARPLRPLFRLAARQHRDQRLNDAPRAAQPRPSPGRRPADAVASSPSHRVTGSPSIQASGSREATRRTGTLARPVRVRRRR